MSEALQYEDVAPGCMVPFDNSRKHARDRLLKGLRRSPHFRVMANGTEFVYCHIPKNACSSFKRLVRGTSEYEELACTHQNEMKFMKKYHRVRGAGNVSRYKNVIFVYRNPFERVVSAFRHKFIMMAGEADVFRNYRKVTGKNPYAANFNEFVSHYLTTDPGRVDGHFRTQYEKLFPVKYTHAIPMRNLCAAMSRIIGPQLAESYFRNRINASGDTEYDEASNDVPVRDMYQRWARTGELPSHESLLCEQARKTLTDVYADDFAMISAIEATQAPRRSGT